MKITKKTSYWKVCKSAEKTKWEDYFKFHLKIAGLPTPETQYQFAKNIGRKWSSDFAWPSHRLIVEIEGGIWRKNEYGQWSGAHSNPVAILRDIEKYNHIALMGYRLFRFSPQDLKSGKAIKMLQTVFSQLKL